MINVSGDVLAMCASSIKTSTTFKGWRYWYTTEAIRRTLIDTFNNQEDETTPTFLQFPVMLSDRGKIFSGEMELTDTLTNTAYGVVIVNGAFEPLRSSMNSINADLVIRNRLDTGEPTYNLHLDENSLQTTVDVDASCHVVLYYYDVSNAGSVAISIRVYSVEGDPHVDPDATSPLGKTCYLTLTLDHEFTKAQSELVPSFVERLATAKHTPNETTSKFAGMLQLVWFKMISGHNVAVFNEFIGDVVVRDNDAFIAAVSDLVDHKSADVGQSSDTLVAIAHDNVFAAVYRSMGEAYTDYYDVLEDPDIPVQFKETCHDDYFCVVKTEEDTSEESQSLPRSKRPITLVIHLVKWTDGKLHVCCTTTVTKTWSMFMKQDCNFWSWNKNKIFLDPITATAMGTQDHANVCVVRHLKVNKAFIVTR